MTRNNDTFQSSGMLHIFSQPPNPHRNSKPVEKYEIPEKPNRVSMNDRPSEGRCQVRLVYTVCTEAQRRSENVIRTLNPITI